MISNKQVSLHKMLVYARVDDDLDRGLSSVSVVITFDGWSWRSVESTSTNARAKPIVSRMEFRSDLFSKWN